jgi:tyrosyl-tRNA synthetase
MSSSTPHPSLPEVLTRGVAEVLPSAQTLAELMAGRKIRLYLGIDPTGAFLTLGHSVPLRKLQQFAELGHQVILLIGNGTVRIGDPTGRDTTRPVLTDEQIQANFKDWQKQASKILDFDKIEIRYNGDWLDKLTYADMVKLLAQTTVQQLIERDMFQERMKNNLPIHGHEILYPLLQGYDSVAMDVDLEIGGTDQTFNMMMGRQLQKSYNNHDKWVLSTPIINGTDGRKMSKSFNNYVALTENPIDMYGKLMRISDEMIVEYFTLLTSEPLANIAEMKQAMINGTNPMEFKKQLAKTITTMYHDESAATQAADHFAKTVQEKQRPDEMPRITLPASTTALGTATVANPTISNSEYRRLIAQGAVSYNDVKVTDPNQQLNPQVGDVIKIGKRAYFQVERVEN